ncbi:uncharacterized protein Z518_00157 [Rhinocladiella mackenziei CBS 650.93]|uniref:NmrA-like domain-containing protein n=1 Tax=Rhinocladiella mackenziei CBS 650.93 TaxID=1442369 RepID=A0A0D2ISW6_9EURO|nr:uncharacterized protein Z518_00157 [Rhinocladiella mackenziei CBS 650.93]KIX09079.1 hypothetical protein Z518_00157 [Rhinocladiella mackenziei CBS 650.93]
MAEIPPRAKSILVLGAGELGTAILDALTSHPLYNPSSTAITLMIRPSSSSHPTPEKQAQQSLFREQGIRLVGGDFESSSEAELTDLFRPYTAVLHAGGMTNSSGTMMKITRAVLAAGVLYYVPWQYGVDYDIVTRQGGQGMFSEQIDVRDLLRSQTKADWVVLSCGIFMSFLFEEFWGVVKPVEDKIQVTALNSLSDILTVTATKDIGRCMAELLYCRDTPVNCSVYVAGDTWTYAEFAEAVARGTGKEVIRHECPVEYLREESQRDPGNQIKRYRVVFAEGRGLSWPKENTWSAERGMQMEGVEEWVRRNYK